MKKKLPYKILLFLLTTIFLLSMISCRKEDHNWNKSFKVLIDTSPKNLDPQSATGQSSAVIIQNCFEGLLRIGADGKLAPAAALDFEASDNGLVYTFKLDPNKKWVAYIDREYQEIASLTAQDFVFGFQRLFSPQTGSKSANNLACIKNAQQVLAGKLSPDKLGVKAIDTLTLEITLTAPNPLFPELLTLPAAMPCNQAFFEQTKGRYGLDKDMLATNGPFCIGIWKENSYIRLVRNSLYMGQTVKPEGVTFSIRQENTNPVDLFSDGDLDAISLSGQDAQKIIRSGYNTDAYDNTVWVLAFQVKDSPFANRDLRRAMAFSFEREAYEKNQYSHLTPAYSIVPPAVGLLDKPYREIAGNDMVLKYEKNKAKTLFTTGLAALNLKKLPKTAILSVNIAEHNTLIGYVQQVWQRDLNAYINLTAMPQSALAAKVHALNYSLAIFPLKADYDSPETILNRFLSTSSDNFTGYSSKEYDSIMSRAQAEPDITKRAALYRQAEQLLIEDAVVIPLVFEREYFIVNHKVSGIQYSPFGELIFYNAVKE